MKACVLHEIANISLENIPRPQAGKGEVLVKIKAAGICGSDIPRVYEKGTYKFPTILGHEFAGKIVEIGKDVNNQLLNKRVAIFPLLPCKQCRYCEIGKYAQCRDYNYFGSRCHGGFAEYIVVPVWNLVFIPDGISYEEAAMIEPAAVALHALNETSISFGDNVAIFGTGTIGLVLAQWFQSKGVEKIFLFDIDSKKVDFAKKLNFKYACNSQEKDPVEWIKENTNNVGVDIAIEGAGFSQTLKQCIEATRVFGKIIFLGNPLEDMGLSPEVFSLILRNELTIKGIWNSSYGSYPRNEWELALDAIKKGVLNLKPLITHRFALEEVKEALELMKNKKEFFIKVMFSL